MQRRVYDALNVLSAMDIIRKDKYNIIYNHYNEHIPSDFGFDWSDDENADDDEDARSVTPMGEIESDINAPGEINLANCSFDAVAQFRLSPQMVQQKEQDVFEMRKRICDKQKLFLELIKQQVSITKLKERNI